MAFERVNVNDNLIYQIQVNINALKASKATTAQYYQGQLWSHFDLKKADEIHWDKLYDRK